jgi:hypothetical protein
VGRITVTPSLRRARHTAPQSQRSLRPECQSDGRTSSLPRAAHISISGQVTLSGSGPVTGVTVTLSGAARAALLPRAASGNYTFSASRGRQLRGHAVPGRTIPLTRPAQTFNSLNNQSDSEFRDPVRMSSVSPFVGLCRFDQPEPGLPSKRHRRPQLRLVRSPLAALSPSPRAPAGPATARLTFTVTANSLGAARTGTLTVAGRDRHGYPAGDRRDLRRRHSGRIITSISPTSCINRASPPDVPRNRWITVQTRRLHAARWPYSWWSPSRAATVSPTPPRPIFTDVPPSNPYFKFVQKLRDLGITGGCSATTYCPNDAVNRGEMAVFHHRVPVRDHPFLPIPLPHISRT